MNKLGLTIESGKLTIPDVINRLLEIKNGKALPEFDHSKASDTTYCVEWGIEKGKWIVDGIIDRYIEELNNANTVLEESIITYSEILKTNHKMEENESRLSELCDVKNRLDKAMIYPDVNYEIGERVRVLVQNITYDSQYNRYEIQEGVIQEYRKRIAGIQDEKFIVKMETKQYPIMAFSRSEMEKLNHKMEENLGYWKQLSFKALIEHGRNNGANIVNNMPWSWKINGKSVTHERDDLYLVECISGIERFEEGDQIRAETDGLRYLPYRDYDDHAPGGGCPM